MERNRKMKIVVVALLLMVISIGVAFSALSTTLNILGQAKVNAPNWGIKFKNLSSAIETGYGQANGTPTLSDTQITNVKAIFDGNGAVAYEFDVVNEGSLDASIGTLNINGTPTCTGSGTSKTADEILVCGAISTTLIYKTGETVSVGDTLNAGETKRMIFTINYDAGSNHPDSEVNVTGLDVMIIYNESGSFNGENQGGQGGQEVESMLPWMLTYLPMDGDSFTDKITQNEFTVMGGNIVLSTTQVKFGNQSYYFSGETGQRINMINPNLNFGTSDFTISFWVYPEDQERNYPIIFSNDNNINLQFHLKTLNLSGNMSLTLGNNWDRIINTGKKYTVGAWTHYAVVRKDGVFTVYENGISLGSTTNYTTATVDLSNLSIGGNNDTLNSPYKGYMDDFVIYNRAIYTENFTPPLSPAGES